MKYCVNCGNELPENSKFCVSCGAEVKKEEVKPVEKKSNGLSVTSMVIGICVHAYQFITILGVMLLIDSVQFLGHLFGSKHHWTLFERLRGSLMFAGYFSFFAIIVSIVGLILGIVGLNKKNNSLAKAGIVLCSTQLVICLIEVLLYVTR